MLVKVFHCGLDHIDQFDFSLGVHFGGLNSALQAALRHTSPSRKNLDTIYIHECVLDLSDNHSLVEEDDLGGNEAWQLYAERYLSDTDIDVIKYTNRYEPDFTPSFYVLNGEKVSLKKVRSMRPHEAEKLVNEFLDYDY